jgi:hypothetical protein
VGTKYYKVSLPVSLVTRIAFAVAGTVLLLTEVLFVVAAVNSPGTLGERLFVGLWIPIAAIVVVIAQMLLKALFRHDVSWISHALADALE